MYTSNVSVKYFSRVITFCSFGKMSTPVITYVIVSQHCPWWKVNVCAQMVSPVVTGVLTGKSDLWQFYETLQLIILVKFLESHLWHNAGDPWVSELQVWWPVTPKLGLAFDTHNNQDGQVCPHFLSCNFCNFGGGDSSVVRAPDSWLKGRGFESLQERRENFLLQGWLSVLTLISVSVPPSCYCSST